MLFSFLQKKGDFRKRMHAQASATLEEQFWEDNACAQNETEFPKRDFLARSFDVSRVRRSPTLLGFK